jgi:hypothetical protein
MFNELARRHPEKKVIEAEIAKVGCLPQGKGWEKIRSLA